MNFGVVGASVFFLGWWCLTAIFWGDQGVTSTKSGHDLCDERYVSFVCMGIVVID